MSTPELPTPYELARIAAAIKDSSNPLDRTRLVEDALKLWKAAVLAISVEQKKLNAPPKDEPQEVEFIISKDKADEAIKWLADNAHKRDKLKLPSTLFDEWGRFELNKGIRIRKKTHFIATPKRMLEFLEFRASERREQNTSFKRRKRNPVK